jgi:hypothetical protein
VTGDNRRSPVALLERWEAFGGVWRSRPPTVEGVVVELCSCHGEVIDRLDSTDPDLVRYLAQRPRSDD